MQRHRHDQIDRREVGGRTRERVRTGAAERRRQLGHVVPLESPDGLGDGAAELVAGDGGVEARRPLAGSRGTAAVALDAAPATGGRSAGRRCSSGASVSAQRAAEDDRSGASSDASHAAQRAG